MKAMIAGNLRLICWSYLLICTLAVLDVSMVTQCLSKQLSGKKYRNTKEMAFHLNYGNSGVEMFNVLSNKEIKEIEILTDCVKQVYPSYFLLSDETSPGLEFGGSNVTILTGILQHVLPDLRRSLLQAASQALAAADWTDTRSYGIRHAYHLSFDGTSLVEYKAAMESIKVPPSFVVLSPQQKTAYDAETHQKFLFQRAQEHARHSKHIRSIPGSVYSLVVLLSDRNEFVGGHVLVEHPKTDIHTPNEDYDDEPLPVKSSGRTEHLGMIPGQGIESLTPERGSVLLLPSLSQGVDEIFAGSRRALVVELWEYNDSPMGKDRAAVEVGKRLGLVGAGQDL